MGRLKARNADESCHRLIACHMVDRNWKFIGNNGMRVGMRKELTRVMVADLKIKVVLGNADPLTVSKNTQRLWGLEQYERTFWKRKR
jgi:hypothetical protein